MAVTTVRAVRVDDDLWTRAQRAAELKGSDVSTEIRKALERFARRVEREEEGA